jgi:hypothetical protein
MATRRNFFAKKTNRINGADPQQIDQKLLIPYITPKKSPAHSGLNAENGALLAHLEPEI